MSTVKHRHYAMELATALPRVIGRLTQSTIYFNEEMT